MAIKLNIIDRKNNKNSLNVEIGTTIRDAIVEKITSDNYGLCGGNGICGTCHVQIVDEDLSKFEAAGNDELETLGTLSTKVGKNSRLGCQITLKDEHNNITVTIAPD